jgi:membrane protease YdiL (CAAX protease family)
VQTPEQIEYYATLHTPEDRPEPDAGPTPNNPPWNAGVAIAVWFVSVLFILVIPAVFLLPYLAIQDPPITDNAQMVDFAKSDPTAVFLQIIAIIPAHILTILMAWLVVTWGRQYPFLKTLGWRTGGMRWWHYVVILGGFLVIAAIVGNFFPEQENELLRILSSSRAAVFVVAFLATFTAPFVEEVIYRGVVYSAFQRTFGIPAAFLFVTLLFALVHVPQYYPSVSTILLLTLLSVILTSIRVKTGNLLPCVILHTLFNGLQSVFLLLEPLLKDAETPAQAVSAVLK